MVDNTWIKEDRKSVNNSVRLTRMKILLCIVILISGAGGVAVLHGIGSSATMYQAEGVVVDFGDYKTCWTDVRYSENTDDPMQMLIIASGEHNLVPKFDEDGVLVKVTEKDVYGNENIYENDSDHTWGLWTIDSGSREFRQLDSYDIHASDYKVVSWAFVKDGKEPTVALDFTGASIYGYAQPMRVVTLSPVCTEIIGSMGASMTIVGTDMYSNYPTSVKEGLESGQIKITGTYTDPSYEAIMSLDPDMVICDGSMLSHVKMANSLRNSDVNCVVIGNGFSLQDIMNSIFIVGAAMNYGMRAEQVTGAISSAIDDIEDMMPASDPDNSVMVTLGPEPSPWVAGAGTFIDDLITSLGWTNSAGGLDWWPQLNSEYISQWNPSAISFWTMVVTVQTSMISCFPSYPRNGRVRMLTRTGGSTFSRKTWGTCLRGPDPE